MAVKSAVKSAVKWSNRLVKAPEGAKVACPAKEARDAAADGAA